MGSLEAASPAARLCQSARPTHALQRDDRVGVLDAASGAFAPFRDGATRYVGVGGGTSGWALAPAPIGLQGVTGCPKKIPVAGPSPGLQKFLFHLKQPRRRKQPRDGPWV